MTNSVKFKLTKSIGFVNLNFIVDHLFDQFSKVQVDKISTVKFKLTKSIDCVNLNFNVDQFVNQFLDNNNIVRITKSAILGRFWGVDNWRGVTFCRVLFSRSQSIVDVICLAIAMVFDSDKLDWSRLCCWAFAFIA